MAKIDTCMPVNSVDTISSAMPARVRNIFKSYAACSHHTDQGVIPYGRPCQVLKVCFRRHERNPDRDIDDEQEPDPGRVVGHLQRVECSSCMPFGRGGHQSMHLLALASNTSNQKCSRMLLCMLSLLRKGSRKGNSSLAWQQCQRHRETPITQRPVRPQTFAVRCAKSFALPDTVLKYTPRPNLSRAHFIGEWPTLSPILKPSLQMLHAAQSGRRHIGPCRCC